MAFRLAKRWKLLQAPPIRFLSSVRAISSTRAHKSRSEMESYKLTDNTSLVLLTGDITTWQGGAIVNAANERMLGGGGVDGAIHDAAGRALLDACKQVPEVSPGVRCPTGEARITKGFNLPAEWVIHTVGPIYDDYSREEAAHLLGACYRNSLALANQYDLKDIAFPAISCGIFGYPLDDAARVAISACQEGAGALAEVYFVLFGQQTFRSWQRAAADQLESL